MQVSRLERLGIGAVVFDMDGLLVDSEKLAMRGLELAAREMGIDAPQAFCQSMIGVPADRCRTLVLERFGDGFAADDFLLEAGRLTVEMIEGGALDLKPGVLELLEELDRRGLPKAVATSSSREKADRHLLATGIERRFDAVVTRDDVDRGKPHPDLFLKAADVLGADPSLCMALEDSYNGVKAAAAAGMRVIMVPDLLQPNTEMREKAVLIAADLHVARDWMFAADRSEHASSGLEQAIGA
jgi:HAD superfamily hydrolase (TIGR01509 family)